MNKDIEDLKDMQQTFQKCANIIGEAIELCKKVKNEKDKEKIKELNEQIEQKAALFLIQMVKIQKLK